ncbi:CU044_5270 family protein [Streptomyces sp. NPDC001980]|uniref:CU044_5270 family protein n=1 Tax=Streptomyces sp. NPDC001980 TaxID=3157126 RepID=UPI0033233941
MDEMTELRALRADAPVPDRARLAAGRARLTDAVRAGERRRALWRRDLWRRDLVIVAVVAAVTAVAVTAALLVGGTGTGHRVQPATPDLDLKGMSAADFLERAADALEKQPTGTEPTGKQWIYTSMAMKPGHGEQPSDYWRRYDGELQAYHPADGDPELTVIPAHLRSEGPDDYDSPRDVYRFLAALPADGGGTLRALRKRNAVRDNGPQAWDDYAEISQLLKVDLVPPAGLASLYRALALLPGGTVTDHLVDTVTGRKAVALTYDITPVGAGEVSTKVGGKTGGAAQMLIDPRTYHVVGYRTVVNGKVTMASERLRTAVVDKAGERP